MNQSVVKLLLLLLSRFSRVQLCETCDKEFAISSYNKMGTHSSVLAWRIPGTGSLVGCHLWGRTESDTTEVT